MPSRASALLPSSPAPTKQRPNFPPADWLQDEGWSGDVLVDDESMTAATAYGLAGYPFLVMLDADGGSWPGPRVSCRPRRSRPGRGRVRGLNLGQSRKVKRNSWVA